MLYVAVASLGSRCVSVCVEKMIQGLYKVFFNHFVFKMLEFEYTP